jgi:hypothetical protein
VTDTLVKPIEIRPPAVDVGQKQAKQAGQPVQRKVVSSLSSNMRISPAKPNLAATPDIEADLAEIRRTWRAYQSTSAGMPYTFSFQGFRLRHEVATSHCALKNFRVAFAVRPERHR